MQQHNDLRPVLARALDQLEVLVRGARPEQAHDRTPCSEYDVEHLVGHVLGVQRRIAAVVSGRRFDTVSTTGVSSDWQSDWASGRREVDEALAAADLDLLVDVPWGQVPVAAALGSYVGELAVHAWDLARATGQEAELDDSLAELALPAYRQMLPATPRGGHVPFAPVVETDENAGPYEQMVAWTGRDPRWSA